MLGLLLWAAILQPSPKKITPLPGYNRGAPRARLSVGPCALDAHRIRDIYAPADAALARKSAVQLRGTQIRRLNSLLWHRDRKGYGGRVAHMLGTKLLEAGEVARAKGRSPAISGERARLLLQAVYEQAPDYERLDEVIAGLGQAALQRCDPRAAQRWFALYAKRFAKGRDRARVLAVLGVLETGAGEAAATALEVVRNRPPPRRPTYQTPEPRVVVAPGDPWALQPAEPCTVDGLRIHGLWIRPDEALTSEKHTQIRKSQAGQIEKILRHDVSDKALLRLRLAQIFLAQGEAHGATGHDPRAAGERARRILRWVYEKSVNFVRLDEVVAGLGQAALLRCDPATARAWLKMHVRRFPRARERARVLAVLAALEVNAP